MSTESPIAQDPEPPRARRDPFTIFLVVACLVLAVLVVLLARENRQLKASLVSLSASQIPPDALKAGDRVEPMTLLADSGEKVALEFTAGKEKTLLLVFSIHCPACEKTLPVWSDLLAAGAASSLRTFGIQLDRGEPGSDPGSLVTPALRFPVFAPPRPEPVVFSKLPYVPATVLLDSRGLVVKTWFGMLTKQQVEEIRGEISE